MTLNDLMARVGYLFLHWGFLENELKKGRGDISSMLKLPGFEAARRVRNLIAHGIVRASADPNAETPYLVCRASEDSETHITFAELGDAIKVLERARFNGGQS